MMAAKSNVGKLHIYFFCVVFLIFLKAPPEVRYSSVTLVAKAVHTKIMNQYHYCLEKLTIFICLNLPEYLVDMEI